jgi:hypothetical protein
MHLLLIIFLQLTVAQILSMNTSHNPPFADVHICVHLLTFQQLATLWSLSNKVYKVIVNGDARDRSGVKSVVEEELVLLAMGRC